MTQTGTSNTTGSPSAGGNLAHAAKNDTRFEQLTGTVEQLAAVAGQGVDVQVKYLLLITQNAFDGVIDNTINKHGDNVDDATFLAERYWKVRNKNVIFDPKAANQRKIIIAVLLGMVGAAILFSVLRPDPVDPAVSAQAAEASDTESPASSTSAEYETCVSKLGPGLERCLELPESMWESCR